MERNICWEPVLHNSIIFKITIIFLHITTIRRLLSNRKLDNKQTNTVPTLENFPFCPADAAIVANIPLADISMI
jgi:hypothetical protein